MIGGACKSNEKAMEISRERSIVHVRVWCTFVSASWHRTAQNKISPWNWAQPSIFAAPVSSGNGLSGDIRPVLVPATINSRLTLMR